jgi:hypothetical protein
VPGWLGPADAIAGITLVPEVSVPPLTVTAYPKAALVVAKNCERAIAVFVGAKLPNSKKLPCAEAQSDGIVSAAQNSKIGGSDPEGGSAVPDATYATPNSYQYANGSTLATSSGVTDYTRFTVSYIVNVAADQAPGVYNTTLTYTASATF